MKNKLFFIFGILVVIFSFIPLADLFHPGLPVTHDGIDHVARIANFYENLREGNVIPRWAGNLNWGYGHPILMFLYPLSSYVASLPHFLGVNLIDSTKIVFGLGMVLSGVFMYLWIAEFLGPLLGLFAGIMYVITPYRFVELYVRGDIGENLAFAFVPLVFYFIYKSSKSDKKVYKTGISISMALLILAHNAISLMFAPLIILYVLLLNFKNKKSLLATFFYLVLGFGIAAFFWLPGLLEGKYTLRNIVTANAYSKRFVDPKDLLYGLWSYGGSGQFSIQLGVMNWIGLLFAFGISLYLFSKKFAQKNLILLLGIFTLFSLFLMVGQSHFVWDKIMLLQNFQFPWRFLAIPVFTTTALLALCVSMLPKKLHPILIILLILLILFFNKDYWKAKEFLNKPESFFTSVYFGTTDTGESAPIWSVRFMEHSFKNPLEVISGNAAIVSNVRTFTRHEYQVTAKDNVRLRENTLYFPGWEVLVDNKKTTVEYQDPANRGLITFFVPKGNHSVKIHFEETKFRLVSDIISIVSAVLLGILSIGFIKKK